MSDIRIMLRDKEFALVPTFEALERVEAASGRSVFEILQDVAMSKPIKLAEIVSIIAYSAQTMGQMPDWWSRANVGAEVCKRGIREFYAPATSWLVAACTPAPTAKVESSGAGDDEKKP